MPTNRDIIDQEIMRLGQEIASLQLLKVTESEVDLYQVARSIRFKRLLSNPNFYHIKKRTERRWDVISPYNSPSIFGNYIQFVTIRENIKQDEAIKTASDWNSKILGNGE